MSSGGGKTQTTVQNSGPPAWAEPYFKQMLNRANAVTNQPYIGYDGPRIAGFSDDQTAGFDMVRNQAQQGNPLIGQANNYISNQLSGATAYTPGANPYSGENPHLSQMIEDSQNEVARVYNRTVAPQLMSQFQSGGAYGGSAHQEALAGSQRELADHLRQISTQMRSEDYGRQAQLAESALDRQGQAWSMNRNNELAALGMIPGLNDARYDDARALMNIGQQQQNLWQGIYDQGYEDFRDWRDYDTNQLGILANALGAVQGGTNSATGPNPNYTSAGQNTAAMAMALASLWG